MQKSLKMPVEQRKGIRALRRLYLGRLGDVLRQRQAINAQLRSAVPSVEGGRQLAHEYLTARHPSPLIACFEPDASNPLSVCTHECHCRISVNSIDSAVQVSMVVRD